MKRDRPAEIEKLLQEAEDSLRVMLLGCLPYAASNGGSLFVNSDYLPAGYLHSRISDEGEALYQCARLCLLNRELAALPIKGSVGDLFIAACAENASNDEHRLGPKRLAMSLLERLGDDA